MSAHPVAPALPAAAMPSAALQEQPFIAPPPAQGIREIFLQIAGAFNQILGPLDHHGSIESDSASDAEVEDVSFDVDRTPHHLGPMNQVCSHCTARFFKTESKHCCRSGAVILDNWQQPPQFLRDLLKVEAFVHKIRAYNCALSLGSSVFTDMTVKGGGPATFKMGGRSWRLLPRNVASSDHPKAAQVYVLSVNQATERRLELSSHVTNSDLRRDWLEGLHNMLLSSNKLVRSFVSANTSQTDWEVSLPVLEARASANNDSIVGALANGGESLIRTTTVPFDGGDHLVIVDDLNAFYQPLHFVLLFPNGNSQWGLHLSRSRPDGRKRKRAHTPLTCADFLRYYIQRRQVSAGEVSIHDFGRLFEEWVVDVFLQAENLNLKFIKRNQARFRRENYRELIRQVHSVPARDIGSPATHLPSTFVRSYRYYRELYADAMRIPSSFGAIDYFVTFTTNPSWPEITENASLKNGMNSPDLYCRVFYLKMKALLYDIIVNGVLGVVVAYCWTVEFQQRGLPHLHALFFVRPEDKPHHAQIIDSKVSAQFPDPADTAYFQAVCQHMIHGPCGVLNPKHYCMKNGVLFL